MAGLMLVRFGACGALGRCVEVGVCQTVQREGMDDVLLVGLCVLARCRCWKCTFQTVEHHGPLCVSRCLGVKKGGG